MTEERYTPRPGLIETDLGSELILLDPETQEMFSLNATGRTAWRHLAAEPLSGVVDRVAAEFEVDPRTAADDIRALVARLLEAGLVARAS
jgi:hypothetical protein